MILRVSTLPSTLHPGAGQAANALHHKIKTSHTIAIRRSDDEILLKDKRITEVVFNNPRFHKHDIIRNFWPFINRLVLVLIVNLKIIKIAKREKLTGIHIHSPMYIIAASVLKVLSSNIKLYLSVHGSEIIYFRKYPYLSRAVLRSVDVILCVSRSDTMELKEIFSGKAKKIKYVGNAYNEQLFSFHERCFSQEVKEIIIVGSLRWQKNQRLAIETVAALGAKNVHLHIVGSGPDASLLKEISESKGCSDRIHFHGLLEPTEIKHLMLRSHFILSTSVTEGFPKAILEGMASGLVPILPNVGEMIYINNEAKTFSYSELTIETLKDCILDAISEDPSQLMKKSLCAANYAQKYTWDEFCELHKNEYFNG